MGQKFEGWKWLYLHWRQVWQHRCVYERSVCSYIDIEPEKKNSKMLSVTKAKKTEPFTSPKGKKIRKSPTAADEDLWFDTIKVGD